MQEDIDRVAELLMTNKNDSKDDESEIEKLSSVLQ